MGPILEIAGKDFRRSFSFDRKAKYAGKRDIFWITIFFILIFFLSLLLLGSREGVLDKFVDVFLGNMPDYGIPVLMAPNLLSKDGIKGIDCDLIKEIKKLGFHPFPYHHFEGGIMDVIALPGNDTWKKLSKEDPDFDGWAVYPDDPIWKLAMDKAAIPHSTLVDDNNPPLQMIIAKERFLKYFDYQKYYHFMEENLPEVFFKALPKKMDTNKEKPLDILWLDITVGKTQELHPIKLHWVDQFHVVDKISFLFTLRFYQALKMAQRFPDLHYYPESNKEGSIRIKQIELMPNKINSFDEEIIPKSYKQFIARLKGKEGLSRGNYTIEFPYHLRPSWVAAFANQYDLQYRVVNSRRGHVVLHRDNCEMELPCAAFSESGSMPDKCQQADVRKIQLDVTSGGNTFSNILIYIPNRTSISDAIDLLLSIKDHALDLHRTYKDALDRYSFLSEMLDTLRDPYQLFLILFVVFLLWAQIGTLLNHKRYAYGIFLVKGLRVRDLYCMFTLQILWSASIGMIFAFIFINIAKLWLSSRIFPISLKYKDTLKITNFNLLPLSSYEYLFTFLAICGLGLLIGYIVLFFMPLRRRSEPARLLH